MSAESFQHNFSTQPQPQNYIDSKNNFHNNHIQKNQNFDSKIPQELFQRHNSDPMRAQRNLNPHKDSFTELKSIVLGFNNRSIVQTWIALIKANIE